MSGTRTIQTAFRFSPEMVQRMKNRSRLRGLSLNAYVEGLIKKDLGDPNERYEALYKELAKIKLPETISPEIEELFGKYKVEFTPEELEADERLAYILSK